MSTNNRKDILPSTIKYTQISLISNKIRILIVGGGKAGFIKTKSFLNKGCTVFVVSKTFINDFYSVHNKSNLHLIKDNYKENLIIDKHLIVIAVKSLPLCKKILNDCNNNYKLYLNCINFNEGLYVMPVQNETDNISFSVHTKKGSPKTSLFLAKNMKNTLKSYDNFVEYACNIRTQVKNFKNKNLILNFINDNDFKFFFDKGVHSEVLMMFFNELIP